MPCSFLATYVVSRGSLTEQGEGSSVHWINDHSCYRTFVGLLLFGFLYLAHMQGSVALAKVDCPAEGRWHPVLESYMAKVLAPVVL